jgi:hypothetical protein
MRRAGVALAIWVAAAACVGPVRSFDTYEGKSVDTAQSAAGHAETSILAAETAARGNLPSPTTTVLVEEAEAGAIYARDRFASIQPPDSDSDALRAELLPLLDRTASTLSEMRIAARRGDTERLLALAHGLAGVADRLAAFADARE